MEWFCVIVVSKLITFKNSFLLDLGHIKGKRLFHSRFLRKLDFLARIMEKGLYHKWSYSFRAVSKYSCFGYRGTGLRICEAVLLGNNRPGYSASYSISKGFCFEVCVLQYVFPAKHMPVIWNRLNNLFSHLGFMLNFLALKDVESTHLVSKSLQWFCNWRRFSKVEFSYLSF